jgi:hypothetical protein
MNEPFQTLLDAAIQAPSGDNTQPWRFVIDPTGMQISLCVDESRDPSPMNAGQGMARIAVGAALENMFQVAKAKGWNVQLAPAPQGAVAALKIIDCRAESGTINPAIVNRVTNRRCYDGRPLSDDLIRQLQQQSPSTEDVRVCWIHDRARLNSLASLISRADSLMLSEPSMRRAFLANIRFDLPLNEEATEYLPVGSLELPWVDRTALRYMSRLPDWLLRLGLVRKKLGSASHRLVKSASGMCVIVAAGSSPLTDVLVGRAMQQTWLALTANNLAAQPMMSVAIFENVLKHGDLELLRSLGSDEARSLVSDFRSVVHEIDPNDRMMFILRFGHASPPSTRTSRRSLETCTTQAESNNNTVGQVFPNATYEGNCNAISTSV